jgi:hypothetical protein
MSWQPIEKEKSGDRTTYRSNKTKDSPQTVRLLKCDSPTLPCQVVACLAVVVAYEHDVLATGLEPLLSRR